MKMRPSSRWQFSLAELLLAAALVAILIHGYQVCGSQLRRARSAALENLPDRSLPDAPGTVPGPTLVLFAAWFAAWCVSASRRRRESKASLGDGAAGDRLLPVAAALAIANAWLLAFFAWKNVDLTPWLTLVALPAIVFQADPFAEIPIRRARRAPLAMSVVIVAGIVAFNIAQVLRSH